MILFQNSLNQFLSDATSVGAIVRAVGNFVGAKPGSLRAVGNFVGATLGSLRTVGILAKLGALDGVLTGAAIGATGAVVAFVTTGAFVGRSD